MQTLSKTHRGAGELDGDIPVELLGVAAAAQPPEDGTNPPVAAVTQATSAPDVLTDSVRADILAAVNRANAAWTAASQSLDASSLDGNVAGQEKSDDLAELGKLRGQGHTQTNVNTLFSVVDVTLDSPGHAIVHTRETWYAEIHAAATGQLIQRTPPSTYQETYILEYQDGEWIVTKNNTA